MQQFVKKANLLRCWESQSPPQYFVDFLEQLQADMSEIKSDMSEIKTDIGSIKKNSSADRKLLENLSKKLSVLSEESVRNRVKGGFMG